VGKSVESQAVLAQLTAAAIFLVVTIDEGGEPAVRDLLADVPGLTRSVGFRILDGQLSCVAGIGSAAWDRLFDGPGPLSCARSELWTAAGTWRPRRPAMSCSTSGPAGWTCASSWPGS
jgi:hypothetical protein